MYEQIFEVASVAMSREQARIRQAAAHIAGGSAKASFSASAKASEVAPEQRAEAAVPGGTGMNTVDDLATIMLASRVYEANVVVVSAARSAFEKALEISGRR